METPDSDPQTQQEAELVTRLRQGDKAALEQLYHLYFDRVYSLVFNQVERNQAIAEEIVQETFLAAMNSVGKFRGQSKLYTWLCSIAYHKVADFYRHQKRKKKNEIQHLDNETIEQFPSEELLASSEVESKETRQVVEQAMLSLPLDYRQVLILKYVEQMPTSEISQIMQRSPKSIEGLLARARKALRARLAESGEG